MPFACSICEQESTRICVYCTKDACVIHICERCGCCSDCCQCDVPLAEPERVSEPAEPRHEAEAPAGFSGTASTLPDSLEQVASSDLPPEPLAPAEAQPATPEEPGAEPFETPEV